MAGLVGPFLEKANRVTSVAVMTRRRTLARMRFAPEESPYRFVAMVPQDVTEKLLVEQLGRKGGAVEYETSFDLVLHGRGNERLLESYNAERRPVIKQVIETTDFLTKVLGTSNKFAQTLRDAVLPIVSRLAPFQRAFVQKRLSELGITYRGSPIVEGAGKRYFDDSLRGGDGIRSRFLLVFDGDAASSTKRAAKQLAKSFSDIVELRWARRRVVMLVRPDGYIGYFTHSHNGIVALNSVRSLLERQTNVFYG